MTVSGPEDNALIDEFFGRAEKAAFPDDFRAGFVAVIGRPNVGKSTLINALLGQKISIVSPKPQTTRNRLLGILTRDDAQIVFFDTPGIHAPLHKLGEVMVETAAATLPDADVLLWVVDVSSPPTDEDRKVAEIIASARRPAAGHPERSGAKSKDAAPPQGILSGAKSKDAGPPQGILSGAESKDAGPPRGILSGAESKDAGPPQGILSGAERSRRTPAHPPEISLASMPVILGLNKMDRAEERRGEASPSADRAPKHEAAYLALAPSAVPIRLSALRGDGLAELADRLAQCMPVSPPLFPEAQVTDQQVRFMAGELVREQVLHHLRDEVPHSVAVLVDEFKERENGVTYVSAIVYVERPTQKMIVLGKDGAMIKQIGQAARQQIEELLETRVFLELWVKVRPKWRTDEEELRRLGYQMPKKKRVRTNSVRKNPARS